MLLVFSYEHSKPKALVPLAWAGAVLAGMAAETLITMGVKATSKAVLKKKADDYSVQLLQNGKFDFMGTNPYRNKDGSITLSPTANDRAKLAGLLSGAMIGSYIGDDLNNACEAPMYDQAEFNIVHEGTPEFAVVRYPIGKYNYFYGSISKIDGLVFDQVGIDETTYGGIEFIKTPPDSINPYETIKIKHVHLSNGGVYYAHMKGQPNKYETEKASVSQHDSQLLNCDELFFPKTVEDIYQPPMEMHPDYKMPNHDLLKDIPFVIYNVFPAGDIEGPVTWNEIEDYYNQTGKNFAETVNETVDNRINNGLIAGAVYNYGDVYNIYTDTDQPIKKEELNPPLIGEIPDLPVPNPDDNLPLPVEPIDKSLLVIAKESYQYLADTVKTSIDGLTAVTAGAAGIITFLSTTMGWLPDEWIVMFSAAFGLGLFAFFFRR